MVADAVVVGAGIVGAAVARQLALAGLSVRVVDRGATAGGTSAHGEGNVLLSDKLPGAELELARYGLRLWPEFGEHVEDEVGRGFPSIEYERKGALVVATAPESAGPLRDLAARQRSAGVDAIVVDPAQAFELEPDLTPATVMAVHYPQDAQVQPTVATEALLAAARRRGAVVHQGVEVLGALPDRAGRLCGVRTSAGQFAADVTVNAAGPWAGELSRRLGAEVLVAPRHGVVLVTTAMRPRIFHKVNDADYVGAVESDDAGLQVSSVVESTAAGPVLIGSSRQQVGFRTGTSPAVMAAIAMRALALFPFLRDVPVMRAYAGFRPFMPDHLPVIGADPRLPGLFHAVGHEGAGVGLSLATGALVRALVTADTPPVDPTPFTVDRPSLRKERAWSPG